MAVIGTFGSFTAARLGIYASQASLNVTGNNIANINTKGYTRQRADLVSLHSAGSARYQNSFDLDIGYGVLVDSVSQLRDPFLDIRYRDEQASVGYYEARMDGLQQISNILDEVDKGNGDFGVLHGQFEDFLAQLQSYNNRVNDDTYDTTVRSSAESIVKFFNTYAKSLTKVKDNQLADLQDDVKQVNTILNKIRDLNVQIRQAGIYHEKALELRDSRNLLIDELSAYTKIEVQYSMEQIDEFSEVEKLSITLADSGNPPIYLINGIYGTQLSMPEKDLARNPSYDPEDTTGMKYLDVNGKPTDLERLADRNTDGSLVENPNYSPAAIAGHKYVAAYNPDGTVQATTDDPDQALEVDNAVKSSDDNRLWMHLEPLVDEKGRYIKDEYGRDIDETVDLYDNTLFGSLQAKRELLTEEGEYASVEDLKFDPDANIKRGIPYYQRALDALARKFATEFNKANTGPDGQPVFQGYKTTMGPDGIERYNMNTTCHLIMVPGGSDAEKVAQKIAAELNISETEAKDYLVRKDISDLSKELQAELKTLQNQHLGELGHGEAIMGGGNLFSVSGDSNDTTDANGVGITAANISIAKDWSVGSVRLLASKNYNFLDNSTANDNIYHMIDLMGEELSYTADEIKDVVTDAADGDKTYFSGSFQQFLANVNVTLATDQQITTSIYTGFETTSLNLDNQRQSVSGVDLNEEATSMMMFQKSYAAACQLMTTLDSMLDKLINGTI